MAQKKLWKDLNLSNAFLFSAALEDPETCKLVLELILEESVGTVNVKAERSILFSSDFRCVRLDIFASNEFNIGYNMAMQNKDEKNLPKRSRYHQAEMDLASLKPGQDFNDLKPSVILFICTFDPFQKGKYRYTFEQRCLEEDFPLGDETKRIFLSTKGKNAEEISKELLHFLEYVENSTDSYVENVQDPIITKLHEKISILKKSRELEGRYMMFEELLQRELKEGFSRGHAEGLEQGIAEGIEQGIERGIKQGIEQGSQRLLNLISRMNENGEADLIPRLSKDEVFYKKMLEKYNL